jgi:hypothetical protein
MAVQFCPLCGSRIDLPRVEINKRYTCKKCHSPFHLNKAGTAVVGEPPSIESELAESKQRLQEAMERVPVKKIVIGLAALIIVLIGGYMLFGPAERLESAGEKAGRALAENDASYFQSVAAPGTADDANRWFDSVHARLVQARERWHGGKEEVVESHVGQEDRAVHKGSVTVSVRRVQGTGLDLSLANPSAATASADTPFDVDTEWTLSRWGRWQLDGHATLAKAQPAR